MSTPATASSECPIWGKTHTRFLIAALLVTAALPETLYWRGAAAAGDSVSEGQTCAVLVLGFPTMFDGTPHPMQVLRVDAAAKAMRRFSCARMVISGGAPHSKHVEAETMADLAVARGVPREAILLETRARNTWENVKFSLDRLEGYDRIVIVSDGLHVHRGYRYLCKQRPDLCGRTVRATDYKPLRLFFFKFAGALHEVLGYIRDGVVYS